LTVIGISAKSLAITRDLLALRDRFSHASLTISAICSESSVITAALSRLKHLFSKHRSPIVLEQLQARPQLVSVCDTAPTGCTLLYSCLDDEVRSLKEVIDQHGKLDWKGKAKMVWREPAMQGLLQRIRGSATALNLLLQCFQVWVCGTCRGRLANSWLFQRIGRRDSSTA
jgi:hypothetical protein